MKVALLFAWDSLRGVYRSPELARRAAQAEAGGKQPLQWEKVAEVDGTQVVRTHGGSCRFEVSEEEVREA